LKRGDSTAAIPILMLTARGEETDRVLGLELGADDYVTKPFSTRELVARVRAIIRRGGREEEGRRILVGGVLSIDPQRYAAVVSGRDVDLTSTEYRILDLLASRKGWVFTRKQILEHLWGMDKIVVDRTVDVHIRHLRKKLGGAGRFIQSIRGVGYKLEG
jgi:two-component system phosphate regulon response regulator PhoB/two-component system alkaline phosphatase synthesis response regulator PhoP